MYQRFIAVGRLGRDPEISTTAAATAWRASALRPRSRQGRGTRRVAPRRRLGRTSGRCDRTPRPQGHPGGARRPDPHPPLERQGRQGQPLDRGRAGPVHQPVSGPFGRPPRMRKPWTPSRPTSRFSTSVSPSMNCRFKGCDIAFFGGDTILISLRERSSAPGGSLTGGPLA